MSIDTHWHFCQCCCNCFIIFQEICGSSLIAFVIILIGGIDSKKTVACIIRSEIKSVSESSY